MKSTTRNLICAMAVTPVVALLAGAPAAAADDGPLAALLERDGTKGSSADLARPVLGPFPYLALDTVRSAGTSRIETRRDGAHEATSLLGPTSSEKYGLKAEGIASRCVTPSKGKTRGGTLIEGGRLQGRKLPEYPALNQQIPLRDGAYAYLNRQVRTAEGYTVIGAQLVDKTGKTTDLAKTRCVTPRKAMAAQRRVPNGTAEQASPADPGPGLGADAVGNILGGLLGGLLDTQAKLDRHMSRKSPVSLSVADELGEKVEKAAAPSLPGGPKAGPQAGLPAGPQTAPKAAPKAQPRQAAPKGGRQAMAAEPEPRLLGNKVLNTQTGDVFEALKGSGTNSGLKSSLFDEKNKAARPTQSGLFGGLPGLPQLPANVSNLLQGYAG
ncbi:hypothetical protein ABGB12_18815 [Actinocorallia sp. B10E7]|uniref:hypothetical protein n=1 Tax=Actinocorallia sp. B10E7 TaxID=3153558 RepID=UPI00325D4E38